MRVLILLILVLFSYTNAIELQKPSTYEKHKDVLGWYMSEKLDGIRAYWDGKELKTRKGKKIFAPKWFIEKLPNFELDGELWTKRADFEHIQNIVMDKIPSRDWNLVTYNIFEVPNANGDFMKRLEKVKNYLAKNPNKHLKIIKQVKINKKRDLDDFFEKLTKNGAEGVIIKDGSKPYHTGRSKYILKLKKSSDMEGEVIAHNISTKTKVLKSLKIKLQNGVIFNLGTGFSKEQRKNPPKIGDIVTFKYYGFTKNKVPRFASFLHIRKD